MKKLFTFATLFMFIALSCTIAQNSQDKYMFTGIYKLDFGDQVKIKIGAASASSSTKEWQGGGKVGNQTIDPETFAQLQSATANQIKIEIESKSTGTLHKVIATDLGSGKVINGIFDSRKNQFTIGSSQGQKTADGAGKTEIGIVKGILSEDKSTISDGTFDIGFIAGKAPLIVTANATFNFTGVIGKPIR